MEEWGQGKEVGERGREGTQLKLNHNTKHNTIHDIGCINAAGCCRITIHHTIDVNNIPIDAPINMQFNKYMQ